MGSAPIIPQLQKRYTNGSTDPTLWRPIPHSTHGDSEPSHLSIHSGRDGVVWNDVGKHRAILHNTVVVRTRKLVNDGPSGSPRDLCHLSSTSCKTSCISKLMAYCVGGFSCRRVK
ncbi:hypothetical protein M404DRAFT_616914 [Pisolithus tinctorius Marx 270]|uniref:Uncharacterized protein n=1 Tax=Pisolithus tinctorius Marx 270 TaxID=870435 RepID=A0A0C3K2I3_PISTI|nr:hypothetical protein M404DRAFT_616914 [Pisolithus tinctorius Marx 270]